MYDMVVTVDNTVELKCSPSPQKNTWHDGCANYTGECFHNVYEYQITMMYTLTALQFWCQFYLKA